jgi:hypothetical protein
MDPTRAYAQHHGLGRVERLVRLRGQVDLGNQLGSSAALCLTQAGLFLVAARDAQTGTSINLLDRTDVSYRIGRLSDTLVVGERELGVPAGKGERTRQLFALARLRQGSGRVPCGPFLARHVESPDEVERAWLSGFLAERELCLAWLDSVTRERLDSPIVGGSEVELVFVLTSERAALLALSDLGDLHADSLEGPLVVEPGFGRARITMGSRQWHSTLGNAGLYSELSHVVQLGRADRLLEVARLNWLGRRSHGGLSFARKLLDQAAREQDARASVLAFLVSAELDEPEPARPDPTMALSALAASPASALAELWVGWEMSAASGRALLDRLRQRGEAAEPWALELHASVHARMNALLGDGEARAYADIALAEHMIACGERERARSVLEARLASLPSEALEDLLPARDADLTVGGGGQALRVRAHELLAQARGGAEARDPKARAELARLQPLVVARVRALVEVAEGDLSSRAQDVLNVLEPLGLVAERERPAPDHAKALTDDLLFGLVRHPLAREGGALLGKLQALLASVPIPDQGVLRDYVEQLTPEQQSGAGGALAHAARLFGLRQLGAFVSRGRKGIGFRSYEGPEAFVLIGGRHLEPESEYRMTPGELAFALGAEVAHLRFGHSRVTSDEVWAGALEKGKQGLDLALGVLPLLRGLKVARRVHQVVQRVPMDALQRAVTSARMLRRGVEKKLGPRHAEPATRGGEMLSAINEEVVAAHRVMQLTADRAGLLLCGDPCAALRAIMLARSDYREELPVAEREGIDVVLARRTIDGKMVHQDLAVRVAALLSFYLSDDWVRLRDAVRPRFSDTGNDPEVE